MLNSLPDAFELLIWPVAGLTMILYFAMPRSRIGMRKRGRGHLVVVRELLTEARQSRDAERTRILFDIIHGADLDYHEIQALYEKSDSKDSLDCIARYNHLIKVQDGIVSYKNRRTRFYVVLMSTGHLLLCGASLVFTILCAIALFYVREWTDWLFCLGSVPLLAIHAKSQWVHWRNGVRLVLYLDSEGLMEAPRIL